MELRELQEKIQELENKNNWQNTSDAKVTFLVEELGELAKYVRQARKRELSIEEKEELSFEFADVLQHLVSLANDFGIDLEVGLRKKKEL